MFEVGKRYEFRMMNGGDEFVFCGDVETYEHPLLKLADSEPLTIQLVGVGMDGSEEHDPKHDLHVPSHPGKIINVTSLAFISAIEKTEVTNKRDQP